MPGILVVYYHSLNLMMWTVTSRTSMLIAEQGVKVHKMGHGRTLPHQQQHTAAYCHNAWSCLTDCSLEVWGRHCSLKQRIFFILWTFSLKLNSNEHFGTWQVVSMKGYCGMGNHWFYQISYFARCIWWGMESRSKPVSLRLYDFIWKHLLSNLSPFNPQQPSIIQSNSFFEHQISVVIFSCLLKATF